MDIRTVLGRIIEGQRDGHIMTILTLMIEPRQQLRVYANELTEQQFKDLHNNAAFIVLEKRYNAQLEFITDVIQPFFQSRLKNAV